MPAAGSGAEPAQTSRRRSAGEPPPQPGRPAAAAPGPATPGTPRPEGSRPALGALRRGARSSRPAPAPVPVKPSVPVEPPAPATGPAPGGPPVAPGVGALPSRDELTKAWGDEVLSSLPPAVKAYVSAGRFLEVEASAAVFALPDRGLLSRAEPRRGEVEAALGAHFGRPVPIRLVLDQPSGAPAGGVGREPEGDGAFGDDEDDLLSYDLRDLADADPAVVSPEQRLLEAFPGAEEVSPP
jgi:hypothetical protein